VGFCCDQNTGENNLKEETDFDSWFQRVWSMFARLHALDENIMMAGSSGVRLSSPHRRHKAERVQEARDHELLSPPPRWGLLLPTWLYPTFCHLPRIPSFYESIKVLIHLLDQNSINWQPNPQYMRLWVTFKIQTITTEFHR
jgi:hypothetical protein